MQAVGTGPFVFHDWQQGESMHFFRNPNYWQTGTPYLDEIVVNVRTDAESMVADLEAGTANLVFQPTSPRSEVSASKTAGSSW
jgi:peptide/nickel transport system substrate-binding protein